MAKAISSAVDVLAAIAGRTELFEIEGVTVELRSLEWAEVQHILTHNDGNNMEQLFQMAAAGIAAPKIEEAQLRKARASFVTGVGKRVAEISGTAQSDVPLAGAGSLPSTP